MTELRDAEIVIVGGGAIGCAIAYRLTEAGKRDVLLVEKEPALASVTTAQAAGLVGQVRELDRPGAARDGLGRDLPRAPAGGASRARAGARSAASGSRSRTRGWREFERLIASCRGAGLAVELIDRAAGRGALAGPGDRRPPRRSCGARATAICSPTISRWPTRPARAPQGARFATGVRVTGIMLKGGAVAGIETDRGRIRCQTVINAAGAHAWHVARMVGLELPIVPVRHQYLITVPTGGIRPDWPCLRVPDATLYGRPDVNALLLGGWEPAAVSCDPRSYPLTGEPPAIEPDWPVLAELRRAAGAALPAGRARPGVRHVFRGWPTFTPDGRFIVGASRRSRAS